MRYRSTMPGNRYFRALLNDHRIPAMRERWHRFTTKPNWAGIQAGQKGAWLAMKEHGAL